MAPWTIKVKFSYTTHFLFGSPMYATGEDRTIELLTWGPAPSHHKLIYGEVPYYSADPSTSSAPNDICSSLNPYVGSYYLSPMMSQGYPIGATILQPLAGTPSSTSSGASTDEDSIKDYPVIRGSICWNHAIEAHRINMVGPNRAPSQSSSSRYTTMRGSKAFNAQTPSNKLVWNLNPDFNDVWLQTIMESIQCMVPQESPLVALIWPSKGLT
jgi:hypothetical protein